MPHGTRTSPAPRRAPNAIHRKYRPRARLRVVWAWVVALASLAFPAPTSAQESIRGFPASLVQEQVQREARARALPSPDTLAVLMRRLTQKPHLAGTPASKEIAELLLARWRRHGFDAHIETFEGLMPMPQSQVVELLGPDRHVATLREPAVPEDSVSGASGYVDAFNPFSADGDVTAEVVYVNYGFLDDYRALDSAGVSVRGKIVLVRDGGMPIPKWRLAADRGAVGCIIFHDPRDEGYFEGDAYPSGPRRPDFSIRSGTVLGYDQVGGDPLSPGSGAVPGAKRLPLADARSLATIPVVTISARDALPFLRNLSGPLAPLAWRGAHPVTYRLGPGGPARARIAVSSEWATRPIYNVIATMPGALSPNQWVVMGVHHDAIGGVGADDPVSALVAMDETMRALAQLRATGWRPARTLVFAAWDAEEWGALGSTEWIETHAATLRANAVAYINGDNVQAGWFRAQGPPSLSTFVSQVIRDIPDPARGVSVLRAWQDGPGAQPTASGAAPSARPRRPFALAPVGMNNDVSPFLLELGVPSVHMAYSGKAGPLGARHTIYETFEYYARFLDPGFTTVALLSQTFLTVALRLADAPVLPFEFAAVAPSWQGQLDDLVRAARANPRVGDVDVAPLRRAFESLVQSGVRFDTASAVLDTLGAAQVRRRWSALTDVNRLLYSAEQLLTDPAPPPGQEYNRHLVHGSTGLYARSGITPFPHLRRAVEDRPDAAAARDEVVRLEAAIARYAARIDQAATALAAALR